MIAANQPPQANSDNAQVLEDSTIYVPVLNNDSDDTGLMPAPVVYSQPANGSAEVINDTIRYRPNPHFNGNDSFTYQARDTNGIYSNVATVYLTITPVNDAPQGSITISGQARVGQTLSLLHSITDADGMGYVNYQWYRSSNPIAGATGSNYQLHNNDHNHTITVSATYRDGGGKTESVLSPQTATVTGGSNRRATYIHTDSLGTPALHTNTTGSEK